MNNKGFAITTILYGALILFCLLLVSMLGILSSYKKSMELLVDSTNGSRDTITIHAKSVSSFSSKSEITERGLYCIPSGECKYISSSDIRNGLE